MALQTARRAAATIAAVLATASVGYAAAYALYRVYFAAAKDAEGFSAALVLSVVAVCVVLAAAVFMVGLSLWITRQLNGWVWPAVGGALLLASVFLLWSWWVIEVTNACWPGYHVLSLPFGEEARCPFS